MTDTVTPAPPQSNEGKVVLDIDYLRQLGKNVSVIDEQIAARSGSDSAIRSSVLTRYATAHSEQVEGLIKNLMAQFAESVPIEIMAGVLTRLPEELEDRFSAPVDELIKGEVDKLKESAKGDASALKEQRKAAMELYRSVKAILEQINVDVSSVPEPKRSGGRPVGGGTSGASKKDGRNKQNYRYFIDGKAQPASQNTFSAWVYYSTLGCDKSDPNNPKRWTSEKMREVLKEQGVIWGASGEVVDGKPADDTFAIELPNGKKVGARRMTMELDADILSDDDSAADDQSTDQPTEPAETQPETAEVTTGS